MSKYDSLHNWLLDQKSEQIVISFADIEKILSFNLPKSARKHQAWWANQKPPSSQPISWMSAGWRVHPELRTKTARFERTDLAPVVSRLVDAGLSNDPVLATNVSLTEDAVKSLLCAYLKREGWAVQVAMGSSHGIDVHARRLSDRWIIEAKGSGSLNPMRVNYFLAVLGETLQRMDDPGAKYSIAFPDLPQFRGLWNRLPKLAKERTRISCLFVRGDGEFDEIE